MSKAYFDYDGLSYSQMKLLLVSPAHYLHAMELRKRELPSSALRLGSAFDAMVFAPDTDLKIWTESKTMQSQSAEKYRRANHDSIVVTEEEHRRLKNMLRSLKDSAAWRFVEQTEHQKEIYGTEDTEHGTIAAKCMMDGINDKIIWDLKTTGFLATDFPYHARKYKYHMQAAWYRHRAAMHDDKLRAFYFVVIESDPPHGVKVWRVSEESLAAGCDDFMRACEIYAKCRAENAWPCYDTGVIEEF